MGKIKYNYVPIPEALIELVDQAVDANKYPLGQYHSRTHYVTEAVKAQLKQDNFLEK